MQEIETSGTANGAVQEAVIAAVARGLGGKPKRLPSWLFYDKTGDALFQQIMRMPEYYPTRCEYDILDRHKDDLLRHFTPQAGPFRLIELGAGDGLKTEILLKYFLDIGASFTYFPIDISANVLEQLSAWLLQRYPSLKIQPLNKKYEDALAGIRTEEGRKVLLFMGANIGNFSVSNAVDFMKKIAAHLAPGDMLLVGIDLKKDPRIIQEAYDDPRGLTRAFNLNLLTRLNRELGARFITGNFSHYPFYDPESGSMKSFLISMEEQSVRIDALRRSVHFDLWESVQTEVSQKYDMTMIRKLLRMSGLKAVEFYFDRDRYFCDVLASLS